MDEGPEQEIAVVVKVKEDKVKLIKKGAFSLWWGILM